MEIFCNDRDRLVEIWLSNFEKNDESIRSVLAPVFAECKKKKYTAVVFESGNHDLFEQTKSLLISNRSEAE